jgi:hypothetical protein
MSTTLRSRPQINCKFLFECLYSRPGKAKCFLFYISSRNVLGPIQTSNQYVRWAIKRLELEAVSSSQTSIEIKKTWLCISISLYSFNLDAGTNLSDVTASVV